jgi:hypothetical protein
MVELLLPCGFDILEYSWVKAIIDICTLANYSVAKKCQEKAGGKTRCLYGESQTGKDEACGGPYSRAR